MLLTIGTQMRFVNVNIIMKVQFRFGLDDVIILPINGQIAFFFFED